MKRTLAEYEEMLSLPMPDGSRLVLGDCFAIDDQYPFFSDGEENYNAQLSWCNENKKLYYDLYPVSDRVRGGACGGTAEDVIFFMRRLVRRKNRAYTEK